MASTPPVAEGLDLDDLNYLQRLVIERIKGVEREVADRVFESRQPKAEYWTSRKNQRERLERIRDRIHTEIKTKLEADVDQST